jgi:UDP-N-acetylmuramate--alanine ligase
MDFSKVKTIYMIGIKGVGMTMLAEFLAQQGYQISGSDTGETFMTDAVLDKAGIKVHDHFSKTHLEIKPDLTIYSTAYNEKTNEEVKMVTEGNFKVLTYAQALGEIFNTHYGIAVCGSHGKTTTSAWLGFVLNKAGLQPNVMVGAQVPQFSGAGLTGSSNLLVVEADEYQNKLQYFNPKMVLLNNIDYDHPDFFPTQASYEQVFLDFIKKLPKSGKLIVNFDDQIIRKLVSQDIVAQVISYGQHTEADYYATEILYQQGRQYFRVITKHSEEYLLENETSDLGIFSIALNGIHNISNALAVIAASIELGVDLHSLRAALPEFTGTARRLQIMGEYKEAIIIDDYAHHPTEIRATIQALKQKYPDKKLRIIFHPHTFTRTKTLLDDFGKSFSGADEVVVLNIYGSAREEHGGVSSQEVVSEIQKNGIENVQWLESLKEVEDYVRATTQVGEVIVLMGAGDVFRIGQELLKDRN